MLACELKLSNVILEFDSTAVVQALVSKSYLKENQVFTTTFSHRKNTLTMALVRRKIYLVIQLPRTKLYFRRQIKYL